MVMSICGLSFESQGNTETCLHVIFTLHYMNRVNLQHPTQPPQPPSRNQEGFASKLEVAMGQRPGLHRRTGCCLQESGCQCEFSVKLCFHNEEQHGYRCPQVLIRSALPAHHLARSIQFARFTRFRANLQYANLCVCWQGNGFRGLGMS